VVGAGGSRARRMISVPRYPAIGVRDTGAFMHQASVSPGSKPGQRPLPPTRGPGEKNWQAGVRGAGWFFPSNVRTHCVQIVCQGRGLHLRQNRRIDPGSRPFAFPRVPKRSQRWAGSTIEQCATSAFQRGKCGLVRPPIETTWAGQEGSGQPHDDLLRHTAFGLRFRNMCGFGRAGAFGKSDFSFVFWFLFCSFFRTVLFDHVGLPGVRPEALRSGEIQRAPGAMRRPAGNLRDDLRLGRNK